MAEDRNVHIQPVSRASHDLWRELERTGIISSKTAESLKKADADFYKRLAQSHQDSSPTPFVWGGTIKKPSKLGALRKFFRQIFSIRPTPFS